MSTPLDPERIRLTGTAPVMDRAGPRGPHLVVVAESSSFPFPLPPRGEILIGRGTEADLPLEERAASRRHATLTITDGQVQITDLGSMNGVRVNAVRRMLTARGSYVARWYVGGHMVASWAFLVVQGD